MARPLQRTRPVRTRRFLTLLALLVVLAAARAASAASFIVPPDRDLIRRADAIVIAGALASFTQLTPENGIETVTPISIEETIKGDVADTINVVEPGGTFGRRSMAVAGAPRFEEGKRMLLFLARTGEDRWAVTELVLGKFSFEHDVNGQELLVRDEAEIVGWDPALKPYKEPRRQAARFLEFVRAEAHGRMAPSDYFVDAAALRLQPRATGLAPAPNIAPYSATSYTMLISGNLGSRWSAFPSGINWFMGTTQEPGAPGGGATAITTSFTSWNNDCGSNVNYVYAGVDDGTHTQGLHGVDGRNTVLFERDLSSWGISPFSCSGNGYSGTLGIGGITDASGTNAVGSETFVTTVEADVEMNKGIANCALLFNSGDWNSAVTHEVGHTLGFRHADQTRSGSAACTTDPSLECATTAIMKSFISQGLNAALQAWDQHAVDAVYPGNVCAPGGTCTPPAITQNPASTTIAAGGSATLSVVASGTAPLSYQWYIGSSGNTASPIGGATSSSVTVSPASTTSYWVRVSNACGSANSATATVTVTTSGGAGASLFLVTPCRIIDTRNPTGPYGGPALASATRRNVVVAGRCGIPSGAKAIAVNVTVVYPTAIGWLALFPGPANSTLPNVSTINYQNRTLANNAVVSVGSDGSINVFNGGPVTVDFLVDVSGYFK